MVGAKERRALQGIDEVRLIPLLAAQTQPSVPFDRMLDTIDAPCGLRSKAIGGSPPTLSLCRAAVTTLGRVVSSLARRSCSRATEQASFLKPLVEKGRAADHGAALV
jgi:hypothetical protein